MLDLRRFGGRPPVERMASLRLIMHTRLGVFDHYLKYQLGSAYFSRRQGIKDHKFSSYQGRLVIKFHLNNLLASFYIHPFFAVLPAIFEQPMPN
jgi:hypothetical protein